LKQITGKIFGQSIAEFSNKNKPIILLADAAI
jgi:hypothetical protein